MEPLSFELDRDNDIARQRSMGTACQKIWPSGCLGRNNYPILPCECYITIYCLPVGVSPVKPNQILARFLLPLALVSGGALAQSDLLGTLFANLQAEERQPRDTLAELVQTGFELTAVTAYSVANADSIGLAVVYAHEAVCLAPDQLTAEQVAQVAIDNASDQARNAVQARLTQTLNNFTTGACDELIDERNTGSQAFAAAAPTGSGGGSTTSGGLPPDVDDDDNDVSPSQ